MKVPVAMECCKAGSLAAASSFDLRLAMFVQGGGGGGGEYNTMV